MANKKISELVSRTPSLTDLMLVGDPSSGYSYKCTITELSTLLEANITLNDLNNVVITAPTNGQVLTYNGTNWVNGNNGITEINGLTAASQSFAVGTSGTDFAIVSSISTHTFNLPTASSTNRGALSSADWSTFNSKIGGSGSTNYLSKFTGTSTIGNSLLFDNGTNVGIATTNPSTKLDVNGDVKISTIANATTDTDRFLVSDSGVIKYRTGSEVLSDIGGAAASSISGTTNYIPKFSASGSINNSQLYQDGNLICIGTTTGSSALTINGDITLFNGRGIFGKNIAGTGNSFSILDTGLVFSEYISDPVLQSSPSISNITLNSNGSISLGNIAAATTDTDRFIVSDSGVIKYRTGSQVLSDIGGAAASSISGTTNYIPKFTSSSAVGNGSLYDDGTNIGLGTTTPLGVVGYKSIDVRGSTGALIEMGNTSNQITGRFLEIAATSSAASFTTFNSAPLTFGTNGSERMRLDASGNLGLGVTPSAWYTPSTTVLQIKNSALYASGNATVITSNQYLDAGTVYRYLSNDFATDYYQSLGQHVWRTAPSGTAGNAISFTQAMTLDASGRLGIGVTSPSAKLQVAGSVIYDDNTNGRFTFESVSAQNDIYSTTTGFGAYKNLRISSNELILSTNGTTERMRITSGGEIVVNGTIPIYTSTNRGNITLAGTSGILSFSINSANSGYVYHTGTNMELWNTANGYLLFATNNTERMRITSGGELLINTTSDAGDYKLQVNGNTYTNGTLTTAAPSGGTAKPWKFGGQVLNTVVLDTGGYIEVEIDGIVYKLATVILT